MARPAERRFLRSQPRCHLALVGWLLLAWLLPQQPVSAGLVVEPVAATAARQAMATLEVADRQALLRRLIEAEASLERQRRTIAEERQATAERLGRLEGEHAHLEAGGKALAGIIAEQRQEVLVRERRLAGLLAEIVQLSRDDGGDRHRLAQLQAVAAGLARPFADAKAALASSEAEAVALAADAGHRQREAAAARLDLAALTRQGGRLAAALSRTRQAATMAAMRAEASRQTVALSAHRRNLAEAVRGLDGLRPAAAVAGRHVQTAAAIERLEGPGLAARAAIASPSLPRVAPLGSAAFTVAAAGAELIPVAGVVVGRFGEGKRPLYDRGITIEVDDRRLVRAPRGGEVVFAGPYAGFGLLLIIDHGGEYHTLLSGLSRLVVDEGWSVQTGQMVGTLEPDPGDLGRLYVELRRSGVPVDPLSWFASGQHKVRS